MTTESELRLGLVGYADLRLAAVEREVVTFPGKVGSGLEPQSPPFRWRRWAPSAAVLLPILVLGGLVHGLNMLRSPLAFDDEGTYISQAWAVIVHGKMAYYTYWYDHPPLGWVLLGFWYSLTGALAQGQSLFNSGREFLLVCHLASCALLFLLARRAGLVRWAAAAAVVLFTISPLAVNLDRLILLDSIATPFLVAAFVLVLSPRRRLAAMLAAAGCLAAAVLIKETSALFVPIWLWQVWAAHPRGHRRYPVTLTAAVATCLTVLYPLYAILKGELLPGKGHVSLEGALVFQLYSRKGTGSVLDPHSYKHELVASWLHADPLLLLGALPAAVVCLSRPRLRPLAAFVLVDAALPFRSGYLPYDQVINVLWPSAIVIAGAAAAIPDLLLRGGWERRATGVLAAIAVLGALFLAVPGDVRGDEVLLTANDNASVNQVTAWVVRHVPRDANVLVNNVMLMHLIRRGFNPARVVWFYKLDLDPGVAAMFPDGWRDFAYLVVGFNDRNDVTSSPLPQVDAALHHSVIVAQFGTGRDEYAVYRVVGNLPPRLRHGHPVPPFSQERT